MDNLNNNFNTAEMQAQIYELPHDVQGYLLSFINGFDFDTLKSANLVSKLWHNTVQELSRQLVDRYFPYFQITQSEARVNNPLKLLHYEPVRQMKFFQNTTLKRKMPLILAALSGDRAAIETENNQDTKIRAYGLFFANGHTCPIQDFSQEEKNHILGQALWYSACNGHFSVVQHLLDTVGADITAGYKGLALQHAAENGHASVVQHLLDTVGADITADNQNIIWAFRRATTNKHSTVIQAINGYRLRMAAVQGSIVDIRNLLANQKPNEEITAEDKGIALVMAAQYGHWDIAEILLQQTGKEISLEYKEGALDILENTPDNNQKATLIAQLRMQLLVTQMMMMALTPTPLFAPHYQTASILQCKRDEENIEQNNERPEVKKHRRNSGDNGI